MSTNQIYFKYVSDSFAKFKEDLKSIKEKTKFKYFILNKEFFDSSEKREKVNHLILLNEFKDDNYDDLIIDPEKDFYLLNKSSWIKIKADFPQEIELKFYGLFCNNKFILKINNQIYYFYYYINNNDNNIKEGYFQFNNSEFGKTIILKFFDSEISSFFKEMKIREINKKQTIHYNKNSFIFRLKTKEKNNDIAFIPKNNEKYTISLKIYKCIYYYFRFRHWTITIFLENQNKKKYKLCLIDSNWLNSFKKKCNYELIKDINEKEDLTDDEIFADFFAKKYPLPSEILDDKPKKPKKIKINNEYYYKDFDFIDEKTLDMFLEAFNYNEYKLKFRLYNVIKKNNIIILIYNNNNLEIILVEDSIRIIKKERLLFTVYKSEDLPIIENAFLSSNYENALTELNIKNKNLEMQKVFKNKNEIATMRNISIKYNKNIKILNKLEDSKDIKFGKFDSNNEIKQNESNTPIKKNINSQNFFNERKNKENKILFNKALNINSSVPNLPHIKEDNKNFLRHSLEQNPSKNELKKKNILENNKNKNIGIKSKSRPKLVKHKLEIIKEEIEKEDSSIYKNESKQNQFQTENNINTINLINDIKNRNTQIIKNNEENIVGGNKYKIDNKINNQIDIKNNNNISNNKNNNIFQNNFFTNNNNISNNIKNNINSNLNHINNNNINKNKNKKRSESAAKTNKNSINIIKPANNNLNNKKNNTFINAIIQCFVNIKPLTKYLLKEGNKTNFSLNESKYKLTNAYIKLLEKSWINNDCKIICSSSTIEKAINEINSFHTNSINFITCFLDILHNELNKANNLIPLNQAINQYYFEEVFNSFSKYFMNNYQSIISQLFYGMFNSLMACANCGCTINTVQCNYILQFPLDEVKAFKNSTKEINILDCFEFYQKINSMGNDNQIFCNNCKQMSNCFNSTNLIYTPNILIISLNNGENIEFKLDEIIDIHNFLRFNNVPSNYELMSMVAVTKPSNGGKNFISFCKSFTSQKWYKYNNEKFNSSFEEAKTTGIPYILFYSGIKK